MTDTVGEMMKGLHWRMDTAGVAHMLKSKNRGACGQFITDILPTATTPIHQKCLESRGKCRFCGKRLSEDYECMCCDYGCYWMTHRGLAGVLR